MTPRDPAFLAWTKITPPITDPFAAFMKGYKEGFAAGCENCLGIEPEEYRGPRIPTIDDIRLQLMRPSFSRKLCDLLRRK